jgi:DNA-binding MarR family transcriptional regulator
VVDINQSLGLLMSFAQKRLQQLVALEAQDLGLTSQQFWVVLLLDNGALDSVQAVGRRIGIDKPAASRLVEALAALGWVRYGEGGDSRRRSVELTGVGRRQAKRFRALAERIVTQMEAGITAAQRSAMDAGLKRIAANLDEALAARGRRSRSRS